MKGYKKDGKFRPIRSSKGGVSKNDRKKRVENAKIQSLIFNKNKFSNTTALEWASDHGFKAVKVEPTKNTIRIRQFSPNKIKRGTECKTIQFGGSGVQGVLCETPDKFKRDRYAKDSKPSTKLGSIFSSEKRPTKVLVKEINDDMRFRNKLIDSNDKLKEEIKSDPQGEFAKGSREEFRENAKEIQNLSKEIKSTYKEIPKEDRVGLDRDLKNELRLLR